MIDAIAAFADQSLPWILEQLEALVKRESPTEDRDAVNAAAALVAGWAKAECGGRPRLHRQKAFGDVLELSFGSPRDPRRPRPGARGREKPDGAARGAVGRRETASDPAIGR